MADPMVLSRSGVFHRLGTLLSDVASVNSSESRPPFWTDQGETEKKDIIHFHTPAAHLSYREDLSTIEHIHIRCRPSSSFDSSIHTSLCEVVLGIFPEINLSSKEQPVLVRGVVERRHRRIKAGDWLLAINGNRLTYLNLDDVLSKYRATRKVRLTVRHPISYVSIFAFSSQPSVILPTIEEKKLALPESIDCVHSVLYYEKRVSQGFQLLYQQPAQKDLFFAAGGVFPTLVQVMHDMNEHDSLLRSISIKLAEQILPVCVASDDHTHYLIIIYPAIEHLHISLLEQHTRQMIRLMNFLFGSIHHGLFSSKGAIEYFFDIFFYRLSHLLSSPTNSSTVLKNIRLIDEFFPAQFGPYGTCPKLNLSDQQFFMNVDCLLNQLECQNFNECSTDMTRYRRQFFVYGSVLFHRTDLLLSHLSNDLTNDIYRFLLHYGHLNMTQFSSETWQLLLFKEIFPARSQSKRRSFVLVCSQHLLTFAVVIQSEYENSDWNVSPEHGLIDQVKLTLNDIHSILPKILDNSSPWRISSPAAFVKKQLKRTISLPLLGAFGQSTKSQPVERNLEDTMSLASSHLHDQSLTDLRLTQLVSQPESQDELYKSNRQSFINSTLSLDEQQQQNKTRHSSLSTYRLHPGNFSTIFYYLDFQAIRGLLIAPYFTLDKLTQTTLVDRLLFETIQQTCVYIRRKHFVRSLEPRPSSRLYSTKARPKYTEIGCQFSLQTDPENAKKKKDLNLFQFWIVGKKCFQPIEHEFFVCYHDSIAQNITELAFTIGMSAV